MIVEYFKNEFRNNLENGVFPIYENIKTKTFFEFNLSIGDFDESVLKDWYFNICELRYYY